MIHHRDAEQRGAGLVRGFVAEDAELQYPPDRRLTPAHIDLDLRVDLDAKKVSGTVTHTIRATAPARTLRLDAVGFDEVVVDAHDAASHYDGDTITVTWDTPFAANEERTVAIRYVVTEPASGIVFSKPTDHDPDLAWFAATDHETERARHWLPTIDHPSVRPTLAFHLRAEERFTVLANGTHEADEVHGDGTKTAHWRLDHPCPSYLTCFCVGELVRWEGGEHRGIPIAAFAPAPHTEADLARTFGPTQSMLAWLEKRLGVPYPFPKYYQFAVPGIGGAMENISLVSWDDKLVLDEAIEPEHRQRLDTVNLHEMAHAWFGDHVVCGDFADSWLKESWATYLESCWLEGTAGEDAFHHNLWVDRRTYLKECERYRRPIVTRRFASSWQLFDMHLYPGGALRLHVLRSELGDDVFWAGVRTYLERFGGRTVETDDFRRVLEEASGRSLARFFEQWLRSPGHPKLKVSFRHDAESGEGTFEVQQTQVDEKADVGLFTFDLELGWVVDGQLRTETIHVSRETHTFTVRMPEAPAQVRVDPRFRMLLELDFDPGRPMLEAQLGADDVLGRIQAGLTLIGSGRQGGLRAVRTAWQEERFWGVRAEWAEGLADATSQGAFDMVVALIAQESDPRVLAPLFRAAAKMPDPEMLDAVHARIAQGLPPRALEAAWEALGAHRERAPFDALLSGAKKRGSGGWAQAGALRALAATRRPEAVEVLADRARDADPRCRGVAGQALGQLAARLDRGDRERAVEHLTALLRAPDARQRAGAAQGLVTAKAKEAIGALEAHRATLTHQERVTLDAGLRAIRRGDGTSKDLETQVETLRDQLRKLEARLAKVEGSR